MGKGNRGNHSKKTWEDMYLDGLVTNQDEFCEDTQQIIRDTYSEFEDEDYGYLRINKKRKKDIYDL